jgi:6-phosphogluconate dehydrogenase
MRLGTIAAYAQGMSQLRSASSEYGYGIDLTEVAKVWRAGCIIRSELLELIRQAFAGNANLPNLLMDPRFADIYHAEELGFRRALCLAIEAGIPTPALSSALAYIDGYRSARLPGNLTQAQRDLFGAHTFERTDKEGSFHNEWGYE